eukprot:35041-Rhodomonas_salina.1
MQPICWRVCYAMSGTVKGGLYPVLLWGIPPMCATRCPVLRWHILQTQIQETAFLEQFVLKIRFLAFDFGVYGGTRFSRDAFEHGERGLFVYVDTQVHTLSQYRTSHSHPYAIPVPHVVQPYAIPVPHIALAVPGRARYLRTGNDIPYGATAPLCGARIANRRAGGDCGGTAESGGRCGDGGRG